MRTRKTKIGLTLIELLMVIAIMSLLATLLFSASYAARRRAKISQATAETRELAKAWKSYWITYGKWPDGYAGTDRDMDAEAMRILLAGEGVSSNDNPQKIKFMDVKGDVLNEGFKDPWGNYYRVRFRSTGPQISHEYYETTVFMGGRKRYSYE
jgi:prepilin-type N-terminal cleavage/methylation domain-containing protein